MTEKEKSNLEKYLDAFEKAEAGDETAFQGMKLILDGEPNEDFFVPDDDCK